MKLRLAFTFAALLLSTFTGAAQEKAQYSIDPSMSSLSINVYKAGVFKAFGHDHLIVARGISGSVQFDAPKIENSSVRLKVATKSLTVVDPGESEKDRSDVQSTMTGEKVLDVTRFAEIVFSSTTVSPVRKTAEGVELTVSGKLDLHGIEKPISFPVSVQ